MRLLVPLLLEGPFAAPSLAPAQSLTRPHQAGIACMARMRNAYRCKDAQGNLLKYLHTRTGNKFSLRLPMLFS